MLVCVAPFESSDIMYQRKTVVLAEAIYTHWLHAIWKKGLTSEYDFLPVCPWRPEELSYTGCCCFSSLTFSLPGRTVTGMSEEQRRVKRNADAVDRRRCRTAMGKERDRIRRRKRYGFSSIALKRWRADQRIRNQRRQNEYKATPIRNCAFCQAGDHWISNNCPQPGRTGFMKTKWKGCYCHLTKDYEHLKEQKAGEVLSFSCLRP